MRASLAEYKPAIRRDQASMLVETYLPKGWPAALFMRRARRSRSQGTVLAICINAMSQAEGFHLCLSVCICG